MILHSFRKPSTDSIFTTLYGTIVAQARSPSFYVAYGVPDSVAGRLDMIVLHLVLLLQRLKREPSAGQSLGQEVFDLFCRDMDDNFREMGVGDLAVPKKMRRVGELFYGRAKAYEDALAGTDAALVEALTRNIFGEASKGVRRLSAYVREAVRQLVAQDEFGRGKLYFPNPDAVPEPPLEGNEQS